MNMPQLELARLIVETLNLEVQPDEIAADAPLFGESGLGLDSIDALELALAIQRRYDVEIKSDDDVAVAAFASLRALSEFIAERRAPHAAVA